MPTASADVCHAMRARQAMNDVRKFKITFSVRKKSIGGISCRRDGVGEAIRVSAESHRHEENPQ